MDAFTRSYERFGLHRQPDNSVIYREYAPGAAEAFLIGDFNDWQPTHKMQSDDFGHWECTVPPRDDGSCAIPHNSKIKISMVTKEGEKIDRIPAWIRRVVQDMAVSPNYDAVFWDPSTSYKWKNSHVKTQPKGLKIYEAHGRLIC